MKKLILICLLIFVKSFYANVTPNSLFQNNMVLQRGKPIAVFGKATSEKSVQVTFKNKTYVAKVENGYWKLYLDTAKAGGPFELTIKGSNKITFSNVLVGEVWLCSGQSNMAMQMKGNFGQPINGSNIAILKSKNSNLRLFTVKRNLSNKPIDILEGDWKLANPESVKEFSATAYYFGKQLQETLNVPVGLICSAWGGTPAEAWTTNEVIKTQFKKFNGWNKKQKSPQKNPSVLYNGMIHPLKPFTIKGAIWYQGEANKNYYQNYTDLFSSMITSWRKVWNQGDFPFYFVQIAPLGWGGENQAYLREAQLNTFLSVKNTGMAVTLDIGEKESIHPAEKQKVGERLALWALANDYGFKSIEYCGPIYKSMKIKNSKAYLEFNYAPQGVYNFGKELTGFKIAGEDKVFYDATAQIEKGKLSVWSKEVKKPIAVRYGFQDWIDGSLFNTSGLPASSFRTDNWE
jgi:sialate O-acetylesterase